MKSILPLFIVAVALISCRSIRTLGIEKRKYRQGYFFNSPSSNQALQHKRKDNWFFIKGKQKEPINFVNTEPLLLTLMDTSHADYHKNSVFASKSKSISDFGSLCYKNKFEVKTIKVESLTTKKGNGNLKGTLLLLAGFIIVIGVELLFPHAASIVSILIAIVVITILILLYRLYQKKKAKNRDKNKGKKI
jgi:hypothetical protein